MSVVIARKRVNQSGRVVEIVLASVALAVSVVALVVALTREPSTAKSGGSTSSTLASERIPNVVGDKVGKARTLLAGVGLVASTSRQRSATVPKGVVLTETPSAGTEVARGTTVALVGSAGP